jgi:hypothetical protein
MNLSEFLLLIDLCYLKFHTNVYEHVSLEISVKEITSLYFLDEMT